MADNRYGNIFQDGTPFAGGSFQNIIQVGNQFFRGDGRPYTFGTFDQTYDLTAGGDDSPVAGYVGDNLPRTRRHEVNLLAQYDASPLAARPT